MENSIMKSILDNRNAPPVETPTPVVSTPVVETPAIEQKTPETSAPVETPVVETPAVKTEAPVEPSTPEVKAPETTPAPVNQGAITDVSDPTPASDKPEYNFSDVLSQKYNGRFKSEAELERFIQEADKPRVEFENDFVASLNHAVKNGVNEQEFMRAYALDPDNMNDREAIRQAEKIKNPSLTDSDLSRIISRKYDITAEEGEDTDPEKVQDAKIHEKMDGGNAKRFLKEFKDKYKVELPNQEELQREATQAQEKNQAKVDQYVKDIDQHITDRGNQKYEISLNEKQKYTYEPSTEQLNAVREQLVGSSGYFNTYAGEGGAAKLFDDTFFAQNHEVILRSMAQAISNDGKKDIINGLVVPGELDSQNVSDGDQGDKSWQQQSAEQFFR